MNRRETGFGLNMGPGGRSVAHHGEELRLVGRSQNVGHPFHRTDFIGAQFRKATGYRDFGLRMQAVDTVDELTAFLFGVGRYRAGVDDVEVGRFVGRYDRVAGLLEAFGQGRTFGEIELAAQRMEGDSFQSVQGRCLALDRQGLKLTKIAFSVKNA